MKVENLNLLRESLPYIQKFTGKTFVIKLSGQVTDNPEVMRSLAEEVVLFYQVGVKVVLVHGGGKQLNALADRLGIEQTMIQGRRVTDSNTLEMAKMVFAGTVRTNILSALRSMGARAVGLSGLDGNIVRAKRREKLTMKDDEGKEQLVDFGHVGDIEGIDDDLLRLLLEQNYIPVISSLGANDKGDVFNINADTIASEIASSLQAEKLILLTNIDGIYKDIHDPDSKISALTLEEAEKLMSSEGIKAGMIPKLKAITRVLHAGVHAVHVVHGGSKDVLLQEVFTQEGSGTMISH
jgi:acetylglutamate kinase